MEFANKLLKTVDEIVEQQKKQLLEAKKRINDIDDVSAKTFLLEALKQAEKGELKSNDFIEQLKKFK